MSGSKKVRASQSGRREAAGTGETLAAAAPKQARSRATRTELIDAARQIFARDGFDDARLEDIAKAAGKTRGAFYDHFQDKEDIFFAIFEELTARNKASLRRRVTRDSSPAAKREALIDHITFLLKDRESCLLNLEFKLYTVRHPQGQKRLAELHAEMCFQGVERLDGLYPEFLEGPKAKRRTQSMQIGALIDGLALNQMFDPGTLRRQAVRSMLAAGLDEVLGPLPQAN